VVHFGKKKENPVVITPNPRLFSLKGRDFIESARSDRKLEGPDRARTGTQPSAPGQNFMRFYDKEAPERGEWVGKKVAKP